MVTRMSLLRTFGTILMVLAVAVAAVMLCGAGLCCESCAHGSLERLDRADRLRRSIARIAARIAVLVRPLPSVAPVPVAPVPLVAGSSMFPPGRGSLLRI